MTDPIRIATIKDKYYCLLENLKILDGPFPDADSAIRAREELETGPSRQLATLSIEKGLDVKVDDLEGTNARCVDLNIQHKGADAYWLCVDGRPHSSFPTEEEAKKELHEIEFGHKPIIAGYWATRTGAGDNLALSGLAAVLAERNGELLIPVKREYQNFVRSLYVDCPQVRFIDAELFCKNPQVGNVFISYESLFLYQTGVDQFERVYRQFGVPYEHRFSRSPVAAACDRVEQLPVPFNGKEYLFLHDDPSRNFRINRSRIRADLPIVHPSDFLTDNLLSFRDIIQCATEGHFIDSGPFNFAQQIAPRGRLVWHQYGKPTYLRMQNNYRLSHQTWEILT